MKISKAGIGTMLVALLLGLAGFLVFFAMLPALQFVIRDMTPIINDSAGSNSFAVLAIANFVPFFLFVAIVIAIFHAITSSGGGGA